jgi:hypothetical protein
MSLLEKIEIDFKSALQKGEAEKLGVLRMLKSSLKNREIEIRAKKQELTDGIAMEIIRQEIKKRREAIEMFKKGNRPELAEKEEKELSILNQYLPPELSEETIKQIIQETIKEVGASGPGDLGKVMGKAMAKTNGQADGNKVRSIVQGLLQGDVA